MYGSEYAVNFLVLFPDKSNVKLNEFVVAGECVTKVSGSPGSNYDYLVLFLGIERSKMGSG